MHEACDPMKKNSMTKYMDNAWKHIIYQHGYSLKEWKLFKKTRKVAENGIRLNSKQDARGPAGYFPPQIIWATKSF